MAEFSYVSCSYPLWGYAILCIFVNIHGNVSCQNDIIKYKDTVNVLFLPLFSGCLKLSLYNRFKYLLLAFFHSGCCKYTRYNFLTNNINCSRTDKLPLIVLAQSLLCWLGQNFNM